MTVEKDKKKMKSIILYLDNMAAINCLSDASAGRLTSSLRTPKIFIKEFGDFLMPCHQHGLGVNLLVQR